MDEPKRKLADTSNKDFLNITKILIPEMNHCNQKLIVEVATGDDKEDNFNYKTVFAPFKPLWRGTKEDFEKLTSCDFKELVFHLLGLPIGSPRILLDLLALVQFGWECSTGVTHLRTPSDKKFKIQTSMKKEVLGFLR